MMGAGILMTLISAWGLWLALRKRVVLNRWFRIAALAGIALPILANASGWIFTDIARQPWIVYGLMQTAKGVSPVSGADVALTTAVFVAVYSVLGVIAVVLITRAARRRFDEPDEHAEEAAPLVPGLVY